MTETSPHWSLVPSPGEEKEVEEKTESYRTRSLPKEPSLDPVGGAGPHEFRRHENSMPLIWGTMLLLGLLVVAVVLFAVMATRKGSRFGVCGRPQSSGASGMEPSSAAHHSSDSGLAAGMPTDIPAWITGTCRGTQRFYLDVEELNSSPRFTQQISFMDPTSSLALICEVLMAEWTRQSQSPGL